MNLKRIDVYQDSRFSETTLLQHGCFLVDDAPYEIEILSDREAMVRGADSSIFPDVIEEFRFYAPHIARFYNQNREIVKEFAPKPLFQLSLAQIQPSQFYVDKDKLSAIRSFIHRPEDIIIQVMPYQDRYIALDGHTRLYAAVTQGWNSVYAVEETSDEEVYAFVAEALRRQIRTPMDMIPVSHREYEEKWNGFCDALFAGTDGGTHAD